MEDFFSKERERKSTRERKKAFQRYDDENIYNALDRGKIVYMKLLHT